SEEQIREATPEELEVFHKELMPQINALYNFAFHLTYNEDDANDLVQETYMKAFRFIDKYIAGTNAKAWLFKILKNALQGERYYLVLQPEQAYGVKGYGQVIAPNEPVFFLLDIVGVRSIS
ncbi:MAG: polymerase sigma factor RpoE, partial [Bacteroidota bacterium]